MQRMRPDFSCWHTQDGRSTTNTKLGQTRIILAVLLLAVSAGFRWLVYTFWPELPQKVIDEREYDKKQMLRNWQENNRPPVPPEFENALRAAFRHADRDGDGCISRDELPRMLDHLGPSIGRTISAHAIHTCR